MGLFFGWGISFLFLIFIVSIRDDSYLNSACISKYICRTRESNRRTYSLDWAKAFEFSSQIIFRGVVAQPCYEEGLERVTSDLWVLGQL